MKEKTITCRNGHSYIIIVDTWNSEQLHELEKCKICGESTTNVWRII